MENSFERLEQQVQVAIDTITRLRDEQAEFASRRAELEGQIKMLSDQNSTLRREIESLKGASVDRGALDRRKRQITRRVEGLLELFENLEEA